MDLGIQNRHTLKFVGKTMIVLTVDKFILTKGHIYSARGNFTTCTYT